MNTKKYGNLINGEWVNARSGKVLESRNPADARELVGAFPASNSADVDDAVAAAKAAFATWRLVPAPRRAEILCRTGELLTQRKEQYAQDLTR